MSRQIILTAIAIIFSVIIIGAIAIQIPNDFFSYDDSYCSVCEWNYCYIELSEYNDIGHGHAGALQEIWDSANYGKKVDVDWYENYRLKYNITSVDSFTLINYSNVCPKEPNLKYLGTGYIVNYSSWEYNDPPYSKTIIQWNNTNRTYYNCRWNPYPYNHNNLTHVFRRKGGAWWNQFKEVNIYDASIYIDKPKQVNQSWIEYHIDYQNYLDHGGVNVGSEY
jgi:hypothetical protein